MPSAFVPHAAIPELASRVTPEMLKVLEEIQQANFIRNGKGVNQDKTAILNQLSELGLVDPEYQGDTKDTPYIWVTCSNGVRVHEYLTGIRTRPHYELPSRELAAWVDEQGEKQWWMVDGDPLLTGRIPFPCPAAHLSRELRELNRPLLVEAKKEDGEAKGQIIGKEKIDELIGYFADNFSSSPDGGEEWRNDRLLYMCWKGRTDEWLLIEDSETAAQMN